MSNELPVACTLTPGAMASRRDLLPSLLGRVEAREDLAAGMRLRFAPAGDILASIAEVIEAERQCCRFLRFDLTVEPDGGPVWLTLSGPPGTQELLVELLAR